MRNVDRVTVHEGTPADDASDATVGTLLNCFFRHAALAKRSMKPNTTDVEFDSLPDDSSRDVRMRGDHDAVKFARDA